MDEEINDQMLIQAARKRLLAELGGGGGSHIENNIYGAPGLGGGEAQAGGGGLFDSLSGADKGGGEDPFDYFVDIARQNVDAGQMNPFSDPDNPEVFDNSGWAKRVHRFRGSKKKTTMAQTGYLRSP